MDFRLTPEQTGFAQSLTELMTKADSVAVARAWAAGDTEPGLALWKRLAEQGVNGAGGRPRTTAASAARRSTWSSRSRCSATSSPSGRGSSPAALAPQVGAATMVPCAPVPPRCSPYALDADVGYVARLER